MPRKGPAVRREIQADPIYQNPLVTQLINKVLLSGKKTVAECVTEQVMMERLRRSGIDYAQGFHIGVPRPIVEVFAQHSSANSTPLTGSALTL